MAGVDLVAEAVAGVEAEEEEEDGEGLVTEEVAVEAREGEEVTEEAVEECKVMM